MRIRRTLACALLAAATLSGCGDEDQPAAAPESSTESTVAPDPGTGPRLAYGNGISGCEGLDLDAAVSEDDLVGSWGYLSTVWFYEGDNAFAYTTGALELTADGRWDGSRKADNMSGTATGPGDWSFDGAALTLDYDDGSDSETYDAVVVSDQVDGAGAAFRALSLIIDYGAEGCLVHTLGSAA